MKNPCHPKNPASMPFSSWKQSKHECTLQLDTVCLIWWNFRCFGSILLDTCWLHPTFPSKVDMGKFLLEKNRTWMGDFIFKTSPCCVFGVFSLETHWITMEHQVVQELQRHTSWFPGTASADASAVFSLAWRKHYPPHTHPTQKKGPMFIGSFIFPMA